MSPRYFLNMLLGKKPANGLAVDDFLDAERERRRAVVDVVFNRVLQHRVERASEDAVELVEDFRLSPEEALQILHPLKVADDDAARVAENVGDDKNLGALVQDGVGLDRGGAVRRLGQDAALELPGVFLGDDAVKGRGDEDFARLDEQVLVGNFVATGESGDAPGARIVVFERMEIESLRVIDTAADIADADNARAILGHARRRVTADVAEALDDDAAVFGQLESFDDPVGEEGDAASGRLLAPKRAADADGLAGDDARDGVADLVRVGVHDPRHGLLVGAHIGRHDVGLRADEGNHLAGVAAGDPFEFADGALVRVDRDAALAAAVGEI